MPKHVDDIFQSALENHHEVADASVWDKLSQTLSSKEGKVVLPWFYNPRKALFVALFISMLSFGGGYIYALLNDGQVELANNNLSKAQITSTVPSINDKVSSSVSNDLGDEIQEIQNDAPTAPDESIFSALTEDVNGSDSDIPVQSTAPDALVFAHNNDERESNAVSSGVSETDAIALTAVVGEGSNVSTIEDESFENLSMESAASSLLEQNASESLEGHLVSIETPITYGSFTSHFAEFSMGRSPLTSSYSIGDDVDESHYKADYSLESNVNYELRFGKYLSPNVGVFAGLRVDRFGFSRDLEQMFVIDAEPNSADEDLYGVVVRSRYDYRFTSYEIPLGVRFKGLHHRLGYHADLGMSFTNGTSQSFSKSVNFDGFDQLNPEISDSKYDEKMGAVAFSRIGLDYYLFANGGLSLDAVLRKRVTATTNSNGAQAQSAGFQVGFFCNF